MLFQGSCKALLRLSIQARHHSGAEARSVDEGEHLPHALIRLPNQVALGGLEVDLARRGP